MIKNSYVDNAKFTAAQAAQKINNYLVFCRI